FHGKILDQVDLDAQRRASVRQSGIGVWTLTYQDVKGALAAVAQESVMGSVTPLSNAVRHKAAQGAKQAHGAEHTVFDVLTLGAFDQLMAFLAHPDSV